MSALLPASARDLTGARALVRELYCLDGDVSELPSDRDWSFLVRNGERRWILKLAHPDECSSALDFEHAALSHLAERLPGVPQVISAKNGESLISVPGTEGDRRLTRLLSWVPGEVLARQDVLAGQQCGPTTWRTWGELLARVDRGLEDFSHPGESRNLNTDLAQSDWVLAELQRLPAGDDRTAAIASTLHYHAEVNPRLDRLPRQVIHNEGNEHNLIAEPGPGGAKVTGIFDCGEAVRTARVFELAVAGSFAMDLAQASTSFDVEAATSALQEMVRAYHGVVPLEEEELLVLFPAARQRMVLSALTERIRARNATGEYARVHGADAWRGLRALSSVAPSDIEAALRAACGFGADGAGEGCYRGLSRAQVLDARHRHAAPMLSLLYENPIEIARGRGAYLFDKGGRAYLDCVNNVSHVGHCHPRVVQAGAAQAARLNTNTRYLSDEYAKYTSRLAALFPEPLEVVFLVNSGSEANELALRIAYAVTGRRGVIATNAGYHGNTQALVDVSAYKHDGKGGSGAPPWVAKVANPDPFRGPYRGQGSGVASAYASQVHSRAQQLRERNFEPAAFLIEALPGCGGQTVPPDGYLRRAFEAARSEGALCIADEVQIGFGRVGSHWWAFDEQGALPDVVTLGKPIGNGHPLGAVVTTRAIAEAFHTGMEWFNTFGGNPVSCAIGSAVLDVIEQEGLRERARITGEILRDGLRSLAERYPIIGDVRGRGMYLGAEFVDPDGSLRPNAKALRRVLEHARRAGVFLSSDGPDNNVLKIKPPIVFGEPEAHCMLAAVESGIEGLSS